MTGIRLLEKSCPSEEEQQALFALLKNETNRLKNEIQVLEKEKFVLGQKIEQMKLATLLLSGVDENKEAKQKINKLIREIDKCIALLNK